MEKVGHIPLHSTIYTLIRIYKNTKKPMDSALVLHVYLCIFIDFKFFTVVRTVWLLKKQECTVKLLRLRLTQKLTSKITK